MTKLVKCVCLRIAEARVGHGPVTRNLIALDQQVLRLRQAARFNT